MVASLAAGRGHGAGAGMIGVAPEAKLLSISVGFGVGQRAVRTTRSPTAVRWAVDNGADVINMSLTRNTLDWPQSWDDAFLYAMEHDVVVVAAAGNRGSGTTEVGAPATMPGVLDGRGRRPQRRGELRRVVAGHHDRRLRAERGPRRRRSRRRLRARGRARAARRPIVAGIVALVRAAHPELDAAQRHQPHHRDGDARGRARCRARSTATGWWMPRPPSPPTSPPVDGEPDGRPRGLDPPVPPRRSRRRCPSRPPQPPTPDAGRPRPAPPEPARHAVLPSVDTLLHDVGMPLARARWSSLSSSRSVVTALSAHFRRASPSR